MQEYIHRVGRTARGEGAKGKALLVFIPEELQFIRYLKVLIVSWNFFVGKQPTCLLICTLINRLQKYL